MSSFGHFLEKGGRWVDLSQIFLERGGGRGCRLVLKKKKNPDLRFPEVGISAETQFKT